MKVYCINFSLEQCDSTFCNSRHCDVLSYGKVGGKCSTGTEYNIDYTMVVSITP
jgi:hypothetical protein